MNDIDQKIQTALRRAQTGGETAGEPNLAEEVLTAFRGRHAWLTAFAFAFSFVCFAIAVWAGWHFYTAAAVREQLLWGALGLWALAAISLLKIWFWLEMQSNRMLRELKRIELLLVMRPPGAS